MAENRASDTVEVQVPNFLGDRWREADIHAEVSSLLALAVVSLSVETYEGEGFDPPNVEYYLVIGPPFEGSLPIRMIGWVPDLGFSDIGEWDGTAVEFLDQSWDEDAWDSIHDALFDSGEAVIAALKGTEGGFLKVRSVQDEVGT